jgi:hypothetical protein
MRNVTDLVSGPCPGNEGAIERRRPRIGADAAGGGGTAPGQAPGRPGAPERVAYFRTADDGDGAADRARESRTLVRRECPNLLSQRFAQPLGSMLPAPQERGGFEGNGYDRDDITTDVSTE